MPGGGRQRKPRAVWFILTLIILVVPGPASNPSEAHQGRHGFLQGERILEAEDYDYPDDGCDPHPDQENHRHTHVEVGSTPPVGEGTWIPWRGCGFTWTDIHFDRDFQFTSARAEQLHDSYPDLNPWWTTITYKLYVDGILHATGTSRSHYFEVQYPPPETIDLHPLNVISRGTYDVHLVVDLNHNSQQHYFVDKIAGAYLQPDAAPATGPCSNDPIEAPGGYHNNGMQDSQYGWWLQRYRHTLDEPATDPEGDPLTYTWHWGDGSTTDTRKRFANQRYTAIDKTDISITVRDDPSDRCTNTPAQEVTFGPIPFEVLGDWYPRVTSPQQGGGCTVTGPIPGPTIIAGYCPVKASVQTNGHADLVRSASFYLRQQRDLTPVGSDGTAPYSVMYQSLPHPTGASNFRVCFVGPDDDIYNRKFCDERYYFVSVGLGY